MERLKTYKYVLQGRLPGLNEQINRDRSHWSKGNDLKKSTERDIALQLIPKVKIDKKVFIVYKWFEENKRRDTGNVAYAKKYIEDALVKCGILQGDGWKHKVGHADYFYIDKDNPRIEIEIQEVENE